MLAGDRISPSQILPKTPDKRRTGSRVPGRRGAAGQGPWREESRQTSAMRRWAHLLPWVVVRVDRPVGAMPIATSGPYPLVTFAVISDIGRHVFHSCAQWLTECPKEVSGFKKLLLTY